MGGYKFKGNRNQQFAGKTKKEVCRIWIGLMEEVKGCGRYSGAEMTMYMWEMIKFNLTGAEEHVLAECFS